MKKNILIGMGLLLLSFSAFSANNLSVTSHLQLGTTASANTPAPTPAPAPKPSPADFCRIHTC